ncbi:hypothetical protein ACP70R_022534 [Stipagrostis hirtigluma subsp. patula]
MAPRRKRARTDRIYAAIDHFAPMGYPASRVRSAVKALLKVYNDAGGGGGNAAAAAWPLLEEASYYVVHEKLFEMEEEEKQLLLEHHQEQEQHQQPPEMTVFHLTVRALGKSSGLLIQRPIDGLAKMEQEAAVDKAPENKMSIIEAHNELPTEAASEENNMAVLEMHDEVPAEAEAEDEEDEDPMFTEQPALEDPMFIEPPALEGPMLMIESPALETLRPVAAARTRRPCFGWLSESESESET